MEGNANYISSNERMQVKDIHASGWKTVVSSLKWKKYWEYLTSFNNDLDLINLLKQHCRKIILFGSCARGEDTAESGIDFFIEADEGNTDKI